MSPFPIPCDFSSYTEILERPTLNVLPPTSVLCLWWLSEGLSLAQSFPQARVDSDRPLGGAGPGGVGTAVGSPSDHRVRRNLARIPQRPQDTSSEAWLHARRAGTSPSSLRHLLCSLKGKK